MMFVLLLLCVIIGGVHARTYVSEPLDIVDGESLQFNVLRPKLENPVTLTRVVACSSIDAPYLPYDPHHSTSTGCSSPGYASVEIYSRDKSVSSKFAARLTNGGRTMYLQKRLINVHTPVVHLEVHGIENTGRYPPVAWDEHVSYVMERRYVPIGVKKKKPKDTEKSYWQQFKDKVSSVIYGKTSAQEEEQNEDEDDNDENDNYGRDHYTSYVMGHHWFVYSLLAMGAFAGLILMIVIAGYALGHALYACRQWKLARSMSYEERHTREQQQKTRSAIESATLKGMFGGDNRSVKRDRSASSRDNPFGTHGEEQDLIEQMFDTDL
jgi:hypothetical protein